LRAWQQEALDDYFTRQPRDYLAAATPGAGKTTFALRIAAELLSRKVVRQLTIVAPATSPAWPSPTPAWPRTRCCTGPAARTGARW
jgi:hypothetical protein